MAEELAESNEPILKLNDFDCLIDEHVRNGEYKTALFWAEKRLALFADRPLIQRLIEIAKYLNVLTIAGQWQMILSICEHYELQRKHTVFVYYAANAMFNTGNYYGPVTAPLNNAMNKSNVCLPADETMETEDEGPRMNDYQQAMEQLDEMMNERKLESRLMLIMAKSFLMIQNRPAAKKCIRDCLVGNPHSSEAFQTAIDAKLLSDREIKKLLSPKTKKSTGEKVMNLLYELRCSKNEPSDSSVYDALSNDVSIQAATAYRLYNKGSISEAYNITSGILSEYGYYENCILVHIACLVALRKHNALYALGHKLVDTMKDNHITWYAIGCYYYTVEQYTAAKKFLEKSTTINSGFGEGWVAYGHVLYYSEEHEQAMNCFLRASRVLEGNFEPLLYIAMQNASSNNYKLAVDFMKDAEQVEPTNPIVTHEQATVAYMQGDFANAEQFFRKSIRQVCKASPRENFATTLSRPCSDFWEPMFQNMGHTLLRLNRYDEAIDVFRKALSLGRNKAEAWANIGICLGCLGKLHDAIEALNEAILMKPGNELIEKAIELLMNQAAREPINLVMIPDENSAEGAISPFHHSLSNSNFPAIKSGNLPTTPAAVLRSRT
ncbi:hypothetical protein M3Y94_00763900 [Aphelenchoides besseyi]|nr:hypothetical protein M3Y94_00763900 [Aphelenchoides besseyi]KAI6232201.1 hypothetical protein M3Y95_00461600 [Aphelenchoides besseyi]